MKSKNQMENLYQQYIALAQEHQALGAQFHDVYMNFKGIATGFGVALGYSMDTILKDIDSNRKAV